MNITIRILNRLTKEWPGFILSVVICISILFSGKSFVKVDFITITLVCICSLTIGITTMMTVFGRMSIITFVMILLMLAAILYLAGIFWADQLYKELFDLKASEGGNSE